MKQPHNTVPHEPLIIGLFVAVAVVIVILLIWLAFRKSVASDGLTEKERKELPADQKEILSMLRQTWQADDAN